MPSGHYTRTEATKQEARRNLAKLRADPEVRLKAIASIKNVWTDKKRKQMSNKMIKVMNKKHVRKKHLKALSKAMPKGKRNWKGGNGQPVPRIVRRLFKLLRKVGFERELAVSTKGHGTEYKVPSSYKVDFGNRKKQIAIELDGSCHKKLEIKPTDLKKSKVLKALGWEVLRLLHD